MSETDQSTYTVTLYATPMSFPLNFTIHSWVEISDGNTTERYDFWAYPGLKTASKRVGHIYQNIFPGHLGTTWSPIAGTSSLKKRQTGRILQQITGPIDSVAHRLHEAISEEAFTYPKPKTYNMFWGPNCNTYIEWLLQCVPEAGMTLPWYAWGKNTKV